MRERERERKGEGGSERERRTAGSEEELSRPKLRTWRTCGMLMTSLVGFRV